MKKLVSLLILASIAHPGSAVSGPPYPGESIVGPCIAVCPAGDLVFRVTGMRNGGPVEGWPIELDLCGCPSLRIAGAEGAVPYWFSGSGQCHIITLTSTPNGVAEFALRAGGVCSEAQITISATLVLGTRTAVASPDQDGDLVVDAADLAIAEAKLGTNDLTMDLDCDGTVTNADIAILQAHQGHHLPPTGVQASPWGLVKARYRDGGR
jgi:hypothetical protein